MYNDKIMCFLDKINILRKQNGGQFSTDHIDQIMSEILEMIKDINIMDETHLTICKEIRNISEKLSILKSELSNGLGIDKNFISSSFDDLNDINNNTEKSTVKIIKSVENIRKLADKIQDSNIKQNLNTEAVSILESCNFQDLTVQQIKRVKSKLSELESMINIMLKTFNIAYKENLPDKLLNGPQIGNNAPNQQEIDDLLNS